MGESENCNLHYVDYEKVKGILAQQNVIFKIPEIE
jgi:hypothetical protein